MDRFSRFFGHLVEGIRTAWAPEATRNVYAGHRVVETLGAEAQLIGEANVNTIPKG